MQGTSYKYDKETSTLFDVVHHWLGLRPLRVIAFLAVLGVGLIGLLDYVTGYEISVSLFYLAPVALAAWYGSNRLGLAIAVLTACTWYGVEQVSGEVASSIFISLWNTMARLGFNVLTAYLLAALRMQLQVANELARVDALTDLLNRRAFHQELQHSIELALRSSTALTVACVDVDDFKAVNDTQGHASGDKLLQAVGEVFKRGLRATDYAARLGGDEFGLVLYATEGGSGEAVITKLQQQLDARMATGGWPVSFSIGVITMRKAWVNADEALKLADELMYEVKRTAKNAIRYREI